VSIARAFGLLLPWMNGNLSLCIVRIVGRRMKLDRIDIIYILMIPVIAMFLIGFYLFLGFVTLLVLAYGFLVLIYEFLAEIDYGFDRDEGSNRL
tara:strand:- start:629 stop:910 length:282 start_codon:yes stop_codon:yes gene_type:complete